MESYNHKMAKVGRDQSHPVPSPGHRLLISPPPKSGPRTRASSLSEIPQFNTAIKACFRDAQERIQEGSEYLQRRRPHKRGFNSTECAQLLVPITQLQLQSNTLTQQDLSASPHYLQLRQHP